MALRTTASLSSCYHPQTMLRCITAANPVSWSLHISWVEYAHNTHRNDTTGMSPFLCSLGYQPPLFPSQEAEIAVPSVRAHILRCQRTSNKARAALLRASTRSQRQANRDRTPAPQHVPGQKVWLSMKDLPLKVASRKHAPRFFGPFEIEAIINPCAVRLRLPPSPRVHPTFHVSLLKPVWKTYSLKVMELYFCAYFELEPLFPQGRAGTTYMWVKGMTIARRDLNPGRWRSGLILIHCATATTSQQIKTFAIHFLHWVYIK